MMVHLFVGTSIAAAWKLGFLTPEDSGAGLRVAGEFWEGTGGMGAGELAAVKERHAELARLQGELRAQEAAMNALQVHPILLSTDTSPSLHFPSTFNLPLPLFLATSISRSDQIHSSACLKSRKQAYIAEMRMAMGRTHGGKIDKEGTNKLLDDAEEWSWGAPEGGFPEADYTSKLAELREQVTTLNGAYFEAVKKDHEEMQARMVSSDLLAAGQIIRIHSQLGYSRFKPTQISTSCICRRNPVATARISARTAPHLIRNDMQEVEAKQRRREEEERKANGEQDDHDFRYGS